MTVYEEIFEVLKLRKKAFDEGNAPEKSYTCYLYEKGVDKICKKVGEESTETVIAAKNGDPDELISETSDLIYHLSVLLNYQGVSFDDVFEKLTARHTHKRRDEYGAEGKIKNK